MGMIHYLTYQKVRGAKVVALCETDSKRRAGDWRTIQGNFGPAGEMMDLSGLRTYAKIEEMIADPDIDMIDVCLPPWQHAHAVVAALKAGKHVFCEKPIALNPKDGRRMVKTALENKRMLRIGHVLPVFPEYAFAHAAAQEGKYGKLLGGNFKRITADPQWLKHFYEPDKIGGPMLDLHIHDAHYIRLLFGMPSGVFTCGRMRGEVAEYFTTQFLYDNNLAVSATSGAIRQQGRSFTHGFEIHFEKATLLYEFAVIGGKASDLTPLTVLTADGKTKQPKLSAGDPMIAFHKELSAIVQAVQTGKGAEPMAADLALDAVTLCQKQTRSLRAGRIVRT
jgi:predicted dehydrogenase